MGRVIPGAEGNNPRRRPRPDRATVIPAALQAQRRAAQELLTDAETQAAARLAEAVAEANTQRAKIVADAEVAASRTIFRAEAIAEGLAAQEQGRLVALAVHIAEKLLGEQLALAPEKVTAIVAQVIKTSALRGRVRLHAHPHDVAALRAAAPALQTTGQITSLQIEEDPTVAPGGCLIETDQGVVDGRIEVQLQNVLRFLRDS